MKKLILVAVILFLPSLAPAQLCGYFGVRLSVHDGDLKPVKGVAVTLTHPEKARPELGRQYLRAEHKFIADETDKGQYVLSLSEGLEVSDPYPVTVTAPGYRAFTKELRFPHCQWIGYDVTLLKTGEQSSAARGTVYDEKRAPVKYARLLFTAKDGAEREINSDQDGRYEIKLLPGEYRVEAAKMYYHTTTVRQLIIPPGGAATQDIRMQNQSWNEDKKTIENGSVAAR